MAEAVIDLWENSVRHHAELPALSLALSANGRTELTVPCSTRVRVLPALIPAG